MRRLLLVMLLITCALNPVFAADEEPTDDVEVIQQEEAVQQEDSSSNLQINTVYRLDSRMMGEGAPDEADIMSAEMEIYASFGHSIDAAFQTPGYTAMKGRGKGMHFGNAWVMLKRNIGEPTYKLGQFVIPFGNLVDYETHTRILQTLYPYSLGIRIDPGLMIEGFIDQDTEFAVSGTLGNGPYRRDIDGNKVITARIARRMMVGDNDLKIGVSALKGRLPVFSLMTDPLMDGNDAELVDVDTGHFVGQFDPAGFADKTRYGVDVEYYLGIDLIRAELVRGTDNGKSVGGYWLQVEHPLSYKTAVIGQIAAWKQSSGKLRNYALGIEHKLEDNRIMRAAYERRNASEHGMDMRMNMFTVQYLLEF